MANASSKARIAVSKLTPCLVKLSAALASSHSKSSSIIDTDYPYFKGTLGVAQDHRLNQPQPLQTRVAVLADDDVVVHGNAERARDGDDRLGHLDVGARGGRIAAW